MKKHYLLLSFLAIGLVCSPTINAAGFMDLLRSMEYDIGFGNNPKITSYSNPISIADNRNNVYTLHDQDINDTAPPWFRIGLRLPILTTQWNTIGLRLHSQMKSNSIQSISAGLYTSVPLGRLKPSAYIAATRYVHSGSNGPISYTGASAPTLTWGLGVQMQVYPNISLQAAYQNTAAAYVYEHQYKFNQTKFLMKDLSYNYIEPVVTIHPSQAFYIGTTLTLPSAQEILQSKKRQYADFSQSKLSKDIPNVYRSFTEVFTISLVERLDKSALVNDVTWLPEAQALCYQVKTPYEFTYKQSVQSPNLLPYNHDLFISEINKSHSTIRENLDVYLFNYLLKNMGLHAQTHTAPPYIKLIVEFKVSINKPKMDPITNKFVAQSGVIQYEPVEVVTLYSTTMLKLDASAKNGAILDSQEITRQ